MAFCKSLTVQLFISVATFWNPTLYIGRSFKGKMRAFDQLTMWQQTSFTPSLLFSKLIHNSPFPFCFSTLNCWIFPLLLLAQDPPPLLIIPLPLQLRWQNCNSTNSCSTYKMDALLRAAATPAMSGRWEELWEKWREKQVDRGMKTKHQKWGCESLLVTSYKCWVELSFVLFDMEEE